MISMNLQYLLDQVMPRKQYSMIRLITPKH